MLDMLNFLGMPRWDSQSFRSPGSWVRSLGHTKGSQMMWKIPRDKYDQVTELLSQPRSKWQCKALQEIRLQYETHLPELCMCSDQERKTWLKSFMVWWSLCEPVNNKG